MKKTSKMKPLHFLFAVMVAVSFAGAPQIAEASMLSKLKKKVTKTLPKPAQKLVNAKDKLAEHKAKTVGAAVTAHPNTHIKGAQLAGLTAVKGSQLAGASALKVGQAGGIAAIKGSQAVGGMAYKAAETGRLGTVAAGGLGVRAGQTLGAAGATAGMVAPQISNGYTGSVLTGATGVGEAMTGAPAPMISKQDDNRPQVLPAGPSGGANVASISDGNSFGSTSVLTGATGVGEVMTSAAPPVIPNKGALEGKQDPNKPQVLPGRPTVPGSAGDIGGGSGVAGEVAPGDVQIAGGTGGPGSTVICVFNCGHGGEGQPMHVGGVSDRRLGEQKHAY